MPPLGLVVCVLACVALVCDGQDPDHANGDFDKAMGGKQDQSWAQFRGSAAHTGVAVSNAPHTHTLHWSFDAKVPILASPAVVADTVYVGTVAGFVYALDAEKGTQKWKRVMDGSIESSPAVSDDGVLVYFATYQGYIVALDTATGVTMWHKQLPGLVTVSSSLTLSDNVLYISVTSGASTAGVYALHGTTGEPVDNFPFVCDHGSMSSPSIAEGFLYFGCNNYRLYKINATTAKQVWSVTTHGQVCSAPAVDTKTGFLYVVDNLYAYAINATNGSTVWSRSIKYQGMSLQSSPAVTPDHVVMFGTGGGVFYALDGITGSQHWVAHAGDAIRSSPVVSADGRVYVGSHDNSLYGFSVQDGSSVFSQPTQSDVVSSPVIVNSTVYIASTDHQIYAYKETDDAFPMTVIISASVAALLLLLVSAAALGYLRMQRKKVPIFEPFLTETETLEA